MKVSIVIPTLVRPTLYPLLEELVRQKFKHKFEIVLVPQADLNKSLIKDRRIKIFFQPKGKGFAYYRNYGVKKSSGEVIVFIDDDEFPQDVNWLKKITDPILEGYEEVITSGYKIKLNQGYMTDAISLLGFPGGGAVGFKTMWPVDQNSYTNHICTGNMAITKKLLNKIGGFDEKLTSGNEDVLLGDKLIEIGKKIKYIDDATVYHIARSGYLNFIKWNILRGKSAYQLKRIKKNVSGKVTHRIVSSISILKETIKTKYFPMVLFMMFSQYFWQTLGFLNQKYIVDNNN